MRSIVKLGVLSGLAALAFASPLIFNSKGDAIKAAEKSGWEEVNVTSTSYLLTFACSKGEVAYEIEGLNSRGQETEATVCCGYPFKSCTIRY